MSVSNPQQTKFLLHAVGVVGVLLGVALWPWTLAHPISPDGDARPTEHLTAAQPTATGVQLPDAAALRRVWGRPLRGPLYDPPPAVAAAKKFVPPPMPVQLTGMIVEPDQSLAIFRDRSGKVEFCNVGQKIGEVEVLEITEDHVVVRYYGESVTMTLDKEGPK